MNKSKLNLDNLKDYQKNVVDYLSPTSDNRALLAYFDVGTGKTRIGSYLAILYIDNFKKDIIIICPNSIIPIWEKEFNDLFNTYKLNSENYISRIKYFSFEWKDNLKKNFVCDFVK